MGEPVSVVHIPMPGIEKTELEVDDSEVRLRFRAQGCGCNGAWVNLRSPAQRAPKEGPRPEITSTDPLESPRSEPVSNRTLVLPSISRGELLAIVHITKVGHLKRHAGP